MADSWVEWWERIAFSRGFIVGFLAGLLLVWMAK